VKTNLHQPTLLYNGSVKRVWSNPSSPDTLWFEFTDDYSVFDWGKMPDRIANKGRALMAFGAFCFEYLSADTFARLPGSEHLSGFDSRFRAELFGGDVQKRLARGGVEHHFRRLSVSCAPDARALTLADLASAESAYMEVTAASVGRPQAHVLNGETVFEYPPPSSPPRLIPLEVVFRFGMPAGSSLTARLAADPSYAARLGLPSVPSEGERFARPVLEFYTKLEPGDRLLSTQEALLISGLSAQSFAAMSDLARLLALALYELSSRRGLTLWDGKFEFVQGESGIMLADSIGPDELRLCRADQSLSKEMIRLFYRGSRWQKSLKDAQAEAGRRGQLDWRRLCEDEFGLAPEPLSPAFKKVVDQLYGVLANTICGRELFAGHPPLDEYIEGLARVVDRERSP